MVSLEAVIIMCFRGESVVVALVAMILSADFRYFVDNVIT